MFVLNEDNFLMFAIKHYDNPGCNGIKEFHDDVKRFKYLKKLLRRYRNNDDLKERLIINHIVILCNVFGVEAATKMLFYKIEQDLWPALKTFMVFLNFMPIEVIVSKDINEVEIPLDDKIIKLLRQL
jgi:hypothetical protein